MRRLILHLGMPRTGSTTLQHVWLRHREALAKVGILYPELRPPMTERRHVSHQYLTEALEGGSPAGALEALFATLESALLSDVETLILSHETWAHRRPSSRHYTRLLELLLTSGRVVQPLVVVKSPAEAVNSAYTLSALFLHDHRHFAARAWTRKIQYRLDLPARLLPWRDPFGGMTAVPLRDTTDAAPLVERVWRATGLMGQAASVLDDSDLTRRENPSPGPAVIEACRRLAAAGVCARQDNDGRREITRAIESAVTARGGEPQPFRGYDAAAAAAMESRWSRANDRFAHIVWGCPWRARVAPASDLPANELARTGDPEGLQLVEAALAEVCPRFGFPVPGPVRRRTMLPALWRRLRGR